MKKEISVMEGSMAVAKAVKACKTDVIAAYPISPQTHIVEYLSDFEANGELNGKYVRVDSEFSASSCVYGSSAAGARSYTASSSQGLLLMTEVLYNIAGTRLPVVITGVNRTVSPPISIQPDHQDTMASRDCGIIQIHVESIQEAYDTHIQAFKIAENHGVLLPVMVCMDGWVLTHAYEPVCIFDEKDVQDFIGGEYKPYQFLDPKNPLSYGAFADEDKLMEYKYLMMEAQENAKKVINDVAKEYKEKFGFFDGGLIDTYKTEDAEIILVAMGSMVSTIRTAVDEMRAEGKKVGVLKVRSFRPFPSEEIVKACKSAKVLGVMDKSISINIGGILSTEVKSVFCNEEKRPIIKTYFAGIGGKEVNREVVKNIVKDAETVTKENIGKNDCMYVNINKQFI